MSEAPSIDKTLIYSNHAWHDLAHEKDID